MPISIDFATAPFDLGPVLAPADYDWGHFFQRASSIFQAVKLGRSRQNGRLLLSLGSCRLAFLGTVVYL